jgi:hypothetical protein
MAFLSGVHRSHRCPNKLCPNTEGRLRTASRCNHPIVATAASYPHPWQAVPTSSDRDTSRLSKISCILRGTMRVSTLDSSFVRVRVIGLRLLYGARFFDRKFALEDASLVLTHLLRLKLLQACGQWRSSWVSTYLLSVHTVNCVRTQKVFVDVMDVPSNHELFHTALH